MNVCAFLLKYICCSGQAYVRILICMHQDYMCVCMDVCICVFVGNIFV